ncbi:hypothetical protein [Acrocarpospora sp. B8E8]|uniref:hypothetical protein n=1 Tax=Acrocarpospora sp. B8E8 TaxID=3153572 RepID=UPI00325D6BAF
MTVNDIETRLGRSFDAAEQARAEAFITDVSALVVTYCRKTFTDESGVLTAPGDVKAVVCGEVIAALNAAPGISSEQIGEIQTTYTRYTAGLSSAARAALRRFRRRIGSVHAGGGS